MDSCCSLISSSFHVQYFLLQIPGNSHPTPSLCQVNAVTIANFYKNQPVIDYFNRLSRDYSCDAPVDKHPPKLEL